MLSKHLEAEYRLSSTSMAHLRLHLLVQLPTRSSSDDVASSLDLWRYSGLFDTISNRAHTASLALKTASYRSVSAYEDRACLELISQGPACKSTVDPYETRATMVFLTGGSPFATLQLARIRGGDVSCRMLHDKTTAWRKFEETSLT